MKNNITLGSFRYGKENTLYLREIQKSVVFKY